MLVIGIAGGTGSGKTTVVNQILNELPVDEVCVISQDSYYKSTDNLSYEERIKINFDHPRAIDFELLEQHIITLKSGKEIQQPIYSFVTHNRTTETLKTQSRKVVIVEGILIFNSKKLLDLFDIKIYISTLRLWMRPPALRQNAHIRSPLAGSSATGDVAG